MAKSKGTDRCCYRHEITAGNFESCIYQQGYEHFEFDGKSYCQFHLPPGDDETGTSSKHSSNYSDEEWEKYCNAFNEAVFEEIRFAAAQERPVVDLRGFEFPGWIDFRLCQEIADTYPVFRNAVFHGHVNFEELLFPAGALFRGAVFKRKAYFNGCEFGCLADFSETSCKGVFDLEQAVFRDGLSLRLAQIDGEAAFGGIRIFENEDTEASFPNYTLFMYLDNQAGFDCRGAQFNFGLIMSDATVACNTYFTAARLPRCAHFKNTSFDKIFECAEDWDRSEDRPGLPVEHGGPIENAWFESARFKQTANFRGRHFKGKTRFNETAFSLAPLFFDCSFDPDCTFAHASFPASYSAEEAVTAISSYRYLKRAMHNAGADFDQSRFYVLEQKTLLWSNQLGLTGKALSYAYGAFADYGHSLSRPFASFLLLNFFFFCIYIGLAPEADTGVAVQFGIEQIVRPFSVWSSSYNPLYFAATPEVDLVKYLATLQSLTSLSILALLFVSLHRHFRMR